MSDYAIVQHGGKQYRVAPGDELEIERNPSGLDAGAALTFERVLAVGGTDGLTIGEPLVEGAVVRAEVVSAERGPKIIVFKKKRRKGYRRTQGHRQNVYRVRISGIEA